MKVIFSFLIFLISISNSNSQHNISAMFVGNSYTMPIQGPLEQIFGAMGDTLNIDLSASGGQTFKMHSEMPMYEETLKRTKFDFVVLQEQSQMPSFPPAQVERDVYPYAKDLVDKLRKIDSCAEPVFYMTWGRENGDKANCPNYKPLCTYAGMQRRLRESYVEMAADNKATISPVGMAWKLARETDANLNLYEPDESHPNPNGAYLTACVFYSVFTKESPYGACEKIGMDTAVGHFLEKIAETVVLDSMSTWRIDANKANARFSDNSQGKTIQFEAESKSFGKHKWYFGDGETAFGLKPKHTYTDDGTYSVSMVHTTACGVDSASKQIVINTTSVQHDFSNYEISIHPNPTSVSITIKSDFEFDYISIINSLGQVQKINRLSKYSLDVAALKSGVYLLVLETNDGRVVKSFVKE